MTLIVADRLIQNHEGVSEHGRQAIAFIDGGTEWLRWAIAMPSARYEFADESSMAGAVQQGLHNTRFALLPNLGLMVSPVKLMTIGLSDLRILAQVEAGEASPRAKGRIGRILEEHDLLTADDLALGTKFLADLGVFPKPLFQAMGFEDLRAIYELSQGGDDGKEAITDLDKEAAAFALAEARSPLEFADYYDVYIDMAAKAGAKANTPDKRVAVARGAVHALLPLMFWALDCPEVDGLVAPGEVAEAVEFWLGAGKTVGFPRLSAGVREIVAHTKYRGERGAEAREFVTGYLTAARTLQGAVAAERGHMGQDGATCTFRLEAGDCEGALQLDPAGVITLSWFRRKPKRKPTVEPTSGRAETETENV